MRHDLVLAAGGDGIRRFVGFSGAHVVTTCRQGSARVFRRKRLATAASENRVGPTGSSPSAPCSSVPGSPAADGELARNRPASSP